MATHRFGGVWTEEKLTRLREYLQAYTIIFDGNERARYFTTSYVDAFAGTGSREESKSGDRSDEVYLFDLDDEDARSFQSGSARIALEIEPGFDQYIFIEANKMFAEELRKMRDNFPQRQIRVESSEANRFIRNWCRETDWRKNRAVVFLDPYGMEVEWSTVKAIAETEAIDVWILFPLGQAVNRLLTRKETPPKAWADRLTRFFGTENWEAEFYRRTGQLSIFGDQEEIQKSATYESISQFFLNRLGEVFKVVSKNPLWLPNSKGIPIYLLCFAAGNPKGAKTALKIADHILRH